MTCTSKGWWEPKGGEQGTRGNWGMISRNIVVYALSAGFLQVGFLEKKVHATNAKQGAQEHWAFGRNRRSSSPQTKGARQRQPPKKSLRLACCQTRLAASLGPKHMGGGHCEGECMSEHCIPWYPLTRNYYENNSPRIIFRNF